MGPLVLGIQFVPFRLVRDSLMKLGRFLYVLNQVVVSPEFRPGRVDELDRVRARIAAKSKFRVNVAYSMPVGG